MKQYKENKFKGLNIVILLMIFQMNIFGQEINYEGEWKAHGDHFENTLKLEKLNTNENLYKFSFVGWRESYDPYTYKIVKFYGKMLDNQFVIQIKDNLGYYTDDTYVVKDGDFSIYNEGEKRCEVVFEFDKEVIRVKTTVCSMIYAGYGVSFDGEYNKIQN